MARTVALQRLAELQSAIDAEAERLPDDLYLQMCNNAKSAYDALVAAQPNATSSTRSRTSASSAARRAARAVRTESLVIDRVTIARVARRCLANEVVDDALIMRTTRELHPWQSDLLVATFAVYVYAQTFDADITVGYVKTQVLAAFRALTHQEKCTMMPALLELSVPAHRLLARDLNLREPSDDENEGENNNTNNNNNPVAQAAAAAPAHAPSSPTANLVTESVLGAALTGFANAIGSRIAPTDMELIRGLLAGIRGRRANPASDPADERPASRRRLA